MSEGFQRVESSKLQSHVSLDHLDITQLNTTQFHPQILQFSPNFNNQNNSKRVGIPPLSPCLHIPVTRSPEGSHSQPLSKPSFFSADSLPPLSPSPYRDPTSDQGVGDINLPPPKTHRRSNSDIPFGFSNILQSSPPLIPSRGSKGFNGPVQYVKRESCWEKPGGENNTEGEVVDDMFPSYINLNNLGRLNSFRAEKDEDLKANRGDSSDNEATSSVVGSGNNMQSSDKRKGIKRSAGGDIAPTTRHYRSVSMDSAMGKMNFADESLKLPPSPGGKIGHLLLSGSIDAKSNTFTLDFGNGVFNDVELKKIMANENLAEMALADPKRVKRILANRQSAARSKERKMRYITELENKVQTLQTETTTLSAQLTLLQRDSGSLRSENNELKFRLQSMEQQDQLRNALNDTLTAEVQRLNMTTMELSEDATNFSQLSISPQMFRLHHQQPQQQNGGATTTHE